MLQQQFGGVRKRRARDLRTWYVSPHQVFCFVAVQLSCTPQRHATHRARTNANKIRKFKFYIKTQRNETKHTMLLLLVYLVRNDMV